MAWEKQTSPETITSTKNPKIKNFQQLQKSKERKRQGLFIVEGKKEIEMALNAGYRFDQVFYCPGILESGYMDKIHQLMEGSPGINEVTQDVYNHIVYRKNVEGITAWAESRPHVLSQIILRKNPLVLVLDRVEKPGNLGGMLRTADAAGIDAVILCDPQTDIYNPNVIRSSLGTVFTVKIGMATFEETIVWLKSFPMSIVCTDLTAMIPYTSVNFSVPCAVVMGTEAEGLSKNWLKMSDRNVIIPMRGKVDSMNVSVSAGILIFEALRQRGKK